MKKAKEILEMIEGRLSSPLIFSFLISWMVFNWNIVLVLLFGLDAAPKETDADGKALYSTLIEYIAYHHGSRKSFWYPVFGALGYTFLNPIVQRYISNFYVSQQQRGNAKNLEIAKEQGLIKGEKYLDVKTKLFEQLEKVQKITEEDSQKDKRIAELESKQRQHENELEKQRNEVRKYSDLYNKERKSSVLDNLDGRWKMTYNFNEKRIEEILVFREGVYSVESEFDDPIRHGTISHFYSNSYSGDLFFVKIQDDSIVDLYKEYDNYFQHKAICVSLKRISADIFKGWENDNTEVTYERLFKGRY